VSFVVNHLDKINRPSRPFRSVGRFDLTCLFSSTSNASPNDTGIVIIVIIIGEAIPIFHNGGIIAQSFLRVAKEAGFLVHFRQFSQAGVPHD
jgi:hypothetical protein